MMTTQKQNAIYNLIKAIKGKLVFKDMPISYASQVDRAFEEYDKVVIAENNGLINNEKE